jgi:hypothetical protein
MPIFDYKTIPNVNYSDKISEFTAAYTCRSFFLVKSPSHIFERITENVKARMPPLLGEHIWISGGSAGIRRRISAAQTISIFSVIWFV